jgi:hypothetical protein
MRFLPHLLAALLATTTLTTSIAAACGGYVEINPAPRVLAVSTHHLNPGAPRKRNVDRAFVVLGASSNDVGEGDWNFIAPRTFDTTQLAMLSPLATATELTLVGPSGTRVVKATQQVALRRGWTADKTQLALEVPVKAGEQFVIAIPGRVTDARWHENHIVRQATTQIGASVKSVQLGSVSTKGRTFAVFSTDGQLSLVELPAMTKA